MDCWAKILSARLTFGWWVFDGEFYPSQRSSWNYKKAEGGGLILDMFPHWRYILEGLVGSMRAVSCRKATRIVKRRDEAGNPYRTNVEDEVMVIVELDDDVLVQIDKFLGLARKARRYADAADRRDHRLGCCHIARLLHATADRHAEADLECRHA